MEKQINVAAGTEILTIFEGTALTPKEKAKVKISGSISAPRLYLEKRKPNESTDHVLYNRESMTIKFVQHENDQLGSEVIGSLKTNPDLKKFNVNSDKETLGTKEMASLLKRNRVFFQDKGKNLSIVNALNSFQATIQTELNKEQDTRGNKKELIEKKVISNIPTEFNLNLPIFVGQKAKTFNVEICFDATDTGVKCWLESADLQELILETRDEIIDSEITLIGNICTMPIIEE